MRAEGPDALTLVDWDSRQARVIEHELRSCDTAGYSAAFGKQTTISVPFKWREAKSDPAFMILSIKQICSLGSDEDFSAVAVVELHPPAKILAL